MANENTVVFSTDFDHFCVLDVLGVFLVFATQPTANKVGQLARGRYMAVALAVGVTDKGRVMHAMGHLAHDT